MCVQHTSLQPSSDCQSVSFTNQGIVFRGSSVNASGPSIDNPFEYNYEHTQHDGTHETTNDDEATIPEQCRARCQRRGSVTEFSLIEALSLFAHNTFEDDADGYQPTPSVISDGSRREVSMPSGDFLETGFDAILEPSLHSPEIATGRDTIVRPSVSLSSAEKRGLPSSDGGNSNARKRRRM